MPNRILRDWTKSEKVNELTPEAERFFTRLIMKADDFGCYHGNIKLLRSDLFPLTVDSISLDSISEWIVECKVVGLLQTYSVNNKDYVHILDFRQRLRNKVSKFPLPENQAENNQEKENEQIDNIPSPLYSNPINQVLLDTYFADFPNSTNAENIARILNIDKSQLIKALPDFRKAANLSYPKGALEFATHFKNWYLKQKKTDTSAPTHASYIPKR